MNSAEHYAEAVRLLESTLVDDMQWDQEKRETLPTGEKIVAIDDERCWIANTIAAAHVHALLALTAREAAPPFIVNLSGDVDGADVAAALERHAAKGRQS